MSAYPTMEEIDRADYQLIRYWYLTLPDPSNDIEKALMKRVCYQYINMDPTTEIFKRSSKTYHLILVAVLLIIAAVYLFFK